MRYINTDTNEYPVGQLDIIERFPNTSFPSPFVPPDGYVQVIETAQPSFDPLTQRIVEDAPELIDGEFRQAWRIEALPDDVIAESAEAQAARHRAELKAERQGRVDALKVTTSAGNTFDGDETSQTRMARAIIALQATGTPSVTWVLADNSVIEATAAELVEALALSGAAQAAIWVIE